MEQQEAREINKIAGIRALWMALGIYGVCTLFSMLAMSIGAGLLFLIWAWVRLQITIRKNLIPKIGAFSRPGIKQMAFVSVGYFLTLLISVVVSGLYPRGYGGQFVSVNWVKGISKLWYVGWPFIIMDSFLLVIRAYTKKGYEQIFRVWLIAFGVIALIGCVQFYIGWPRPRPIPLPGNPQGNHFHVQGFLGHHLAFASVFLFPFFVVLDMSIQWFEQRFKNKKLKFPEVKQLGLPNWVFPAFTLIGFLALMGTYSRTQWVVLPLTVLTYLFYKLTKHLKKSTVFALLGGVIAVGVAASFLPEIQNRLHYTIGVSERKWLWRAHWQFFLDYPLFGTGWQQNQDLVRILAFSIDPLNPYIFVGHAHNIFLEILASTGILGSLAMVAYFATLIGLTIKNRSTLIGRAGWFFAWVTFLLNGLTQVNLWDAKVMHVVAWFTALLLVEEYRRRTS